MKKLLAAADQYIRESDWKVTAVLKFCLLSLGMILGMQVPEKRKKPVLFGCLALFAATYVPLMTKLLRLLLRKSGAEFDS